MQAYCINKQHAGWIAVNGGDTPNSISTPFQATQPQPVAPSSASADETAEVQFVTTVAAYRKAYDGAANDMQKGALRPERGRALCQITSSTNVRNWHGEVYSLSSNNDGNGVIELDLGSGIYVKTMNNTLSDLGYHTLIPFGTPLFNQVSQLRKGADIIFSGELFHDPVDCFKEMSLTVHGTMTEPEFVIRVTAVGHEQFAPQVATPSPMTQASPTTTPPQDETAAFAAGQNARVAYEQWFSGLSEGDYRSSLAYVCGTQGPEVRILSSARKSITRSGDG